MAIKIALVGNPNSGKTTLFNALTGSSQHVGNWPGVTVEKKEGRLKGYKDVLITDLPGVYSLSPYTLEEVISRNYIIQEKPDVIIDIIDASNLERNLFLTLQLRETGIPVIVALNMMDIIRKRGESIDTSELSNKLKCPVVEISAVKEMGIKELIDETIQMAGQEMEPLLVYSPSIEACLQEIHTLIKNAIPYSEYAAWYSVKVFEREEKILQELSLENDEYKTKMDELIKLCEEKADDDSESIIINERYAFIGTIIPSIHEKKSGEMTTSDKIDLIVTNKWLALPIFFTIMWFIYYISISTIGDYTIGWVEAVFGFIGVNVENVLVSLKASDWSIDLMVNGIIGSIGAIFIYVPQLMILFLFLSLLEDSGYMARIAFIMDRIFRKFGLSGKSFIPFLIGTGCSIPGVMASRTIENEKDRRMTIMLTPFVPCGAKLPVFAMFIALIFPTQTWVGPSIYLIALVGIIVSGILLKRTKQFGGDPAPFIMELPEYKLPHIKGVTIHMWEKAKSFVKKAGTIIFIACTILWFLQSFNLSFQYIGSENIDESILASLGNMIKWLFIPLGFGDSWAAPVASVTGLIAKEVVVATFASVGAVMTIEFTQVSAFAFMIFTIFSAPCFAAIGAMHREFGDWKKTLYAVLYQTGLAYVLAMLVNVIGSFVLKGTDATKPIAMDYSLMEKAGEGAVVQGDIVIYIFIAIIIVALIIGMVSFVKGRASQKQYNSKEGRTLDDY